MDHNTPNQSYNFTPHFPKHIPITPSSAKQAHQELMGARSGAAAGLCSCRECCPNIPGQCVCPSCSLPADCAAQGLTSCFTHLLLNKQNKMCYMISNLRAGIKRYKFWHLSMVPDLTTPSCSCSRSQKRLFLELSLVDAQNNLFFFLWVQSASIRKDNKFCNRYTP